MSPRGAHSAKEITLRAQKNRERTTSVRRKAEKSVKEGKMLPVIVGVDEAGRAPLAGPVVAGACHLSCEVLPNTSRRFPSWSPQLKKGEKVSPILIADSKKLSAEEREIAFVWITTHCPFGVGSATSEEVDETGILEATQKAMQEAVAHLSKEITPTYLLIDGRDQFWFDYPKSSIIRGDETEPCIAAASILAKVTRDRIMIKAAKKFPHYGFERHKGYGTREHFKNIEKYGMCVLHRRTFLKKIASP